MRNFSVDLKQISRLNRIAPPVLHISHNDCDNCSRAWIRETINVGLILSAPFPEAVYELDSVQYPARIPACAFIRPGPLFRQRNPGPCEKLTFSFDPSYLEHFPDFQSSPDRWMIHFPLNERIRGLLSRIFELCSSAYLPGNADRLDLCTSELLTEICAANHCATSPNDPFRETIFQIASRMETDLSEKIDPDEAAVEYGMSPRNFRRHWMRVFGEPPGIFLQKKRLEEAKRLLLETDLKIYEISNRIGMNDSFYFTRFFKKHTGLSPKAFRTLTFSALFS